MRHMHQDFTTDNSGSGAIANFVHQMIYDEPGSFGPSFCIGFLDQYGMLEAGIVLHNYYKPRRSIELSAASIRRTWMTIGRLNLIGDFVYKKLNCWTMVARHDPDNKVARRLWTSIGGTEHILPELRGPGKCDCMHVLTADEARLSRFWRL